MFTTYNEARAVVLALNERIHATNAKAPAIGAGSEAHIAWNDTRRAQRKAGEEFGFIRIFDGSFKLNAGQVALPKDIF